MNLGSRFKQKGHIRADSGKTLDILLIVNYPIQEIEVIDTLDSGMPRAGPYASSLGNTSARVDGVQLVKSVLHVRT